MRLSSRVFITALTVAACGGVVAAQSPGPIAPRPASRPAPAGAPAATPAPPMFSGAEYAMGDPHAPVTVVEYASASCPHCARFDIGVFPAFKSKYIDTGKVRYIFREFLTPPEQFAAAGFLLARCAGEARYWTVVEAVFHAQAEIYATQNVQGIFYRIGRSVGLAPAQIDACLASRPALEALNARMDDAVNRQKIDGTPTFIVNGEKPISGEADLAKLSATIDPLLPRRRS